MATVAREQAGTYRQLSARLRVQRGPGVPDLVSERPRSSRQGPFQDSDAAPTLIELREGDQADVPFLLAIGAIMPIAPAIAPESVAEPETSRQRRRERGGSDG